MPQTIEPTVPEIFRRDVVIRRADFGPLSRGETLVVDGTDLTLTLDEPARVVAALIENADLVDPRGVRDSRLAWLERSIRAFLFDDCPETRADLQAAYDGCFTT
jgi:hypothetical protein